MEDFHFQSLDLWDSTICYLSTQPTTFSYHITTLTQAKRPVHFLITVGKICVWNRSLIQVFSAVVTVFIK